MTVRTPTYLKSAFENADIPQAADYEDLFDSFLPLSATAKQTLGISLEITGDFTASGDVYCKDIYANKINAQRVSASGISFNTVDADTVSASVINTNRINANFVSASGGIFNVIEAQKVSASAGNFNLINSQQVSASVINTNQLNAQIVSASVANHNILNAQYVSASVARIGYIVEPVVVSIAATGTVTASAAVVSAALNVINAVTSASEEGLRLKKARPGFTQMIINGTSTSAKVFPVSASKFNGQANGAPVDIPQNRTIQIFHITSAQFYTATHTR